MSIPKQVPVRVDAAGGWLDTPSLARPGAFIVNCTITPMVSLDHWPYERCSGIGGSAAYAILNGRNAVSEELSRAGWQDPAAILETGLCVWRSGPMPVLEMKANPDFLTGRMALLWTGKSHDTGSILAKKRDYDLIEKAGAAACRGVRKGALNDLADGINLSYAAQLSEGMPIIWPEPPTGAMAAKYCGSGWGGYALVLFGDTRHRAEYLSTEPKAMAVEPYMRTVTE